jgi:hypothetical protein
MDVILISHPSESTLLLILTDLTKMLRPSDCALSQTGTKNACFSIFRASYQWTFNHPQNIEIRKHNFKTLNDLQKLLGYSNWLRCSLKLFFFIFLLLFICAYKGSLKLTTDILSPLFQLLKGDPNPHFEDLQRTPNRHWLR